MRGIAGLGTITDRGDGFDDIRKEIDSQIKSAFAAKRSNIQRKRFMTITLTADSVEKATTQFNEVLSNISIEAKQLGVILRELNGKERLEAAHSVLNLSTKNKFFFDWEAANKRGLTEKDFIVPSCIEVTGSGCMKIEDTYVKTFSLLFTSATIDKEVIVGLVDREEEQVVSISMSKLSAKDLKKTASDQGYKEFMETILETGSDVYATSIQIFITSETEHGLTEKEEDIKSFLLKHKVKILNSRWQDASNIVECACLGVVNSMSQQAFIREDVQSLLPNKTAITEKVRGLFYGVDTFNRPFIFDKFSQANKSSMYLGGDGKSGVYTVSKEILMSYLFTNDRIVIIDPDDKFEFLVTKLNGVSVSLEDVGINFMENYGDYPIIKSLFVELLGETAYGGKYQLSGIRSDIKSTMDAATYSTEANLTLVEVLKKLEEKNDLLVKKVVSGIKLKAGYKLSEFDRKTGSLTDNRIIRIQVGTLDASMQVPEMYLWLDYLLRTNMEPTRLYVGDMSAMLKAYSSVDLLKQYLGMFSRNNIMFTGIESYSPSYFEVQENDEILDLFGTVFIPKPNIDSLSDFETRLGIPKSQLKYAQDTTENRILVKQANGVTVVSEKSKFKFLSFLDNN